MERLREQLAKETEAKWFERGKAVHGAERWELIELALRQPVSQVALVNGFLPEEVQSAVRLSQQLSIHEDMEVNLACECISQPPTDRKAIEFRSAASVLDTDDGAPPRPAAAFRSAVQASLPLLPCCFMSAASVLAAQVQRLWCWLRCCLGLLGSSAALLWKMSKLQLILLQAMMKQQEIQQQLASPKWKSHQHLWQQHLQH